MSTDVVKQPSSHSRDIPRDEYEALLAAQRTGRVAWNAPDGCQVLLVPARTGSAARVVAETAPPSTHHTREDGCAMSDIGHVAMKIRPKVNSPSLRWP